MPEPTKKNHLEARWPVILSVVIVLVMLIFLPERIRLLPNWVLYTAFLVQIVPLVAVPLSGGKPGWLRAERTITMTFGILAGIMNFVNLYKIIEEMLRESQDLTGLELLASGLGVWTGNVLAFSLLFWLIDRGGPHARSNDVTRMPDWLFPQEGAPREDIPRDWKPVYLDYLFLGYCTATAFSPTDALPITGRAKLLIMFESSVSLLTILVVLSRSINILGS
jgi:hypothetical protein